MEYKSDAVLSRNASARDDDVKLDNMTDNNMEIQPDPLDKLQSSKSTSINLQPAPDTLYPDASNSMSKSIPTMEDYDSIAYDLANLPHKKRLVIVVDRRLNEKDDDNKDDIEEQNTIYMFMPPKYADIPKDYVKEWFLESSYQCIIPSYSNKQPHLILKSSTSEKGWLNTFSFHIEQEDEIRCYLYRTGEVMRFEPKDIIDFFPQFFNMNDQKGKIHSGNNKWIEDAKVVMNNINQNQNKNDNNFNHDKQLSSPKEIMAKLDWKDVNFETFRSRLKNVNNQ